jgi:broad specificity phosphatase PhoE
MGSLILVRHATTAASAAGRNLGRSDDPPLAAEGLALAGRLAETLATELAELPHDEIDYGEWDGLTADEGRARDPDRRAAWETDPYGTRCPGGESGADVALRAFAILEPLEAWLAEDRARCAIVVAHNHVNRLRLCALFGWPMRAYRDRLAQDPAGYSLIGLGGDAPVIRRVNAAPA